MRFRHFAEFCLYALDDFFFRLFFRPEKIVRARLVRQDPVDDEIAGFNPELRQLPGTPCRLEDGGAFGFQDKDEGRPVMVLKIGNRLFVFCLCTLERGARPDTGRAAVRQGLGPAARELQEPDRVPRRSRVEDDDIVSGVIHELDELVKGRHLLHAGAVQLLLDDGYVLFIQDVPQGGNDPLPVFLGGLVRVYLDGMEIFDAVDRRDVVSDLLAEDVREIWRGIRCDEKGLISLLGKPHGRCAAHGALADAALAAEKDELDFLCFGNNDVFNHDSFSPPGSFLIHRA